MTQGHRRNYTTLTDATEVVAGFPEGKERTSIHDNRNGAPVVYPAQEPVLCPGQGGTFFFGDSHS